jgi:hypothetical protein
MFVSCKCCSVVCGQVEVHVMGHSLIRRSPIKHGDLTDQKDYVLWSYMSH